MKFAVALILLAVIVGSCIHQQRARESARENASFSKPMVACGDGSFAIHSFWCNVPSGTVMNIGDVPADALPGVKGTAPRAVEK